MHKMEPRLDKLAERTVKGNERMLRRHALLEDSEEGGTSLCGNKEGRPHNSGSTTPSKKGEV